MRTAFVAAGVIALLGVCAAAPAAEPSGQWLTGAEFSRGTSYAYLGHVAPLPGSAFGAGFVRRIWVDWSRYRYDSGGQMHAVDAPGAALAVGYQHATATFWWGAFAGLTYRHSGIAPDDPASAVRGGMVNLQLQVEGERTLAAKWKIGGHASYTTGQRAYWARGRLLRDIASGMQAGVEAIALGDPDFGANQLGLVLADVKLGIFDATAKLGARQVHGLAARPYFGIELGRMY